MPRCIAFLRAVNVGGRIVKMDALRGHFEAAGFTSAETFIASGNVIFDTKAKAGPAAGCFRRRTWLRLEPCWLGC